MKVSERLQKRIFEDCGISVHLPQRIPRGCHGRSGGGWAWSARYKYFAGELGSEDTMTECVNAKTISVYTQFLSGNRVLIAE